MQNRRHFLKQLAISSAAATLPLTLSKCSKSPKRPNVIIMMTDDQGYGDFGVMGNPVIKTPNLDAMAERSTQMENFYVCSVCAPTRASLMTGRYHYRTRVVDTFVGRAMMDPEEITMAELLGKAGYATGLFGKWHLGDSYPLRPQDQGFDEVLMHRGGGIGQPSDPPGGEGKYTDPILFHNGEAKPMTGYCTDIYFDSAISWMEKQLDQNKNFFAYIATNAPHGPFHDVPKDLYEMYKKMNLATDQFPQEKGHPLPETSEQQQDILARIFAMVTNVDENVGKLFKKLDSLNQLENTLVLFLVDNGPNSRRYVRGLNGMKTNILEGGVRSPLFMHLPGTLQAGFSTDRIAAHIDLLPTILDACNVPQPTHHIDGRSLWPLVTQQNPEWPDRHIVMQVHRGDTPVKYHNFMIRNQKWKMLHNSGFGQENFEGEPQFELYNMENDPLAMQNVSAENPQIVKQLTDEYDKWFDDVSSTRPDNYEPPRIHIGSAHENPVTLTRQDWRHFKGGTWAKNSNGVWKVNIEEKGSYDFDIRFKDTSRAGSIELKIGDQIHQAQFSKEHTELSIKNIQLPQGDADLLVTLKIGTETKGPWQVDVMKI